ncbi:putative ribonuclease H-like domain-containing protein [Tanacetum coccineum]
MDLRLVRVLVISNEVRKSPDAPLVKELVSDDKLEKKAVFPTVAKIEFANCNYYQRERVVSGNNYTMVNYNYSTIKDHLSAHRNMDPRIVLMKTGLRPLNTARPTTKNLMEDMLLLGEEPNEEELLVNELLKLNSVLFTDTRCFVLSSDFKLADDSKILLKVHRKNNMYSVDIKNIVPKERLTCLVAKATLDESMLWHRRLGIKREFSVARTPQQNGVAKRRNQILIEATRTMLADSKLPTTFWAKAVNTVCYVKNRVLVVNPHNKTSYELFRGRTHSLSFMRPFGCRVTILNTLDYLGKFDRKSDEGFFVGYSLNSKEFRVYNIRTRKVEEDLHIRFLEDKPIITGTEESIGTGHSSKETGSSQDYILMPLWKDGSLFDSSSKNVSNDEPQPSSDAGKKDDEDVSKESGIDDQERPENRTQDVNTIEPSINTAITNINTGSLNINTVSPTVTPAPLEATHADFFGDKTKVDISNITTTYPVPSTPNTRIYKDHSLDHEEPKKVIQALKDPSWIEAMQDELLQFKLQQMDVKSAFLYGKIEEEVYVYQPPGFEDPEFTNRVYKVEKALYGLHQAPRAWYETLSTYLLDNGFHKGQIDKTLFIKRVKGDILLVQVYVNDIIFGSTRKEMCTEFEKMMHKKFQMSSMGEITFFLGLQVTQKDNGIFISQDKYVSEILKKFGFSTVMTASTPMETSKPLLKDSKAKDVDVHLYRSMIGSLMYLTASRLDIIFVVCACAKFETTPKASHLHAVKRIFRYLKGQPKLGLWYPKDSLFDLEAYTNSDYTSASLDRKSTIRVKNLVFHSKTMHIKIRHHFIRDSNEKKLIQMIKIHTDQNVVDLLTKAFDVGRFQYLIASIRMLNL